MNILKKATFIFALCATTESFSDGSEKDSFKFVDNSLLDNYLVVVSNRLEGGEASLRFSRKFIEQFSDSCELTVQLQAFSLKKEHPQWHRGAGASFVGLSPAILLEQGFYVGGIGQSLIVNIIYFTEGCEPREESLRFNINL